MCKASVLAEEFRDGEVGDDLGIYTGEHGLGTFYEHGTKQGVCATCLQTGASLAFEEIPPVLQQKLGIGRMEPVTFIETEGSELNVVHDLVRFDNHVDLHPVPVAVFANVGVTAVVTMVPEMELDVSDVTDGPVHAVLVGIDPRDMADTIGAERIAA